MCAVPWPVCFGSRIAEFVNRKESHIAPEYGFRYTILCDAVRLYVGRGVRLDFDDANRDSPAHRGVIKHLRRVCVPPRICNNVNQN